MANDTTPRNFLIFRYLLTASKAVQGDWIDDLNSPEDAENKRQILMCKILDTIEEATKEDDIRFWKEYGLPDGEYLFHVQRITSVKIEQKFKKYSVQHEPSAWVAIDTAKNGQTIAIESGKQIAPSTIIKKLTSILQPYFKKKSLILQVNPLSRKGSFWKFVDANKEQISEVVFRISPPNMAGLTSALTRQMSDFAGGTNAKESIIAIKSKRNSGLELNKSNRKLGGVVAQVEGGAGEYSFKLKKSNKIQRPTDTQEIIVAAPKMDSSTLPLDSGDPNTPILEKLKNDHRLKS